MANKPKDQLRRSSAPPVDERAVELEMTFSGPLPPPGALAKYEELSPGLADRIVQMAEREQAHRHAMAKQTVRSFYSWQAVGQFLGWSTALSLVGVGAFAVAHGDTVVAVASIAAVTSVLTIFVLKRRPGAKKNDDADTED